MSDQSIVQEALSLAKRLACETRRIDEAECRLAARLSTELSYDTPRYRWSLRRHVRKLQALLSRTEALSSSAVRLARDAGDSFASAAAPAPGTLVDAFVGLRKGFDVFSAVSGRYGAELRQRRREILAATQHKDRKEVVSALGALFVDATEAPAPDDKQPAPAQ